MTATTTSWAAAGATRCSSSAAPTRSASSSRATVAACACGGTSGPIEMDLDGIDEIDTLALGGADTFSVGDLTGTPVDLVDVSLAPSFGSPGGDGQADRVQVAGTDRADAITVAGSLTTARLTGLSATVNISHAEGALDTLAVDTRGGDDTVDSAGLAPGVIGLSVE